MIWNLLKVSLLAGISVLCFQLLCSNYVINIFRPQKGQHGSDMERIMQDGFGISKLMIMANDMLGAPTTIIYAYRLFAMCIAMFFSTGLFKILDGGLT